MNEDVSARPPTPIEVAAASLEQARMEWQCFDARQLALLRQLLEATRQSRAEITRLLLQGESYLAAASAQQQL